MRAQTPIGKFYFPFFTKDDDAGAKATANMKRGTGFMIPATLEGYAELTTDTAKQQAYLDDATAWTKEYSAFCKEIASKAFPDKDLENPYSKKGMVWDLAEKTEDGLYWLVRAKTKHCPRCADRLGERIKNEAEIEEKFSAGNWGVIYITEPQTYKRTDSSGVGKSLLNGAQYMCDGEPVAGGGADVTFAALPEAEIQAGDFAPADNPLAGLE